MRLKQIRLAGFKSFADPTAFEVPGRLIGVVGPNGCGKSNIIDAVRWVLGESRASELRGESMQDVIFSGSAQRKPASRASVELVFDNTLGRIGGAWGSFAELSVKRVLTRDGQSTYFINNQAVRRKDVHDIFLGTGLGPRAYAIIGQGTISRLVEARPEELRVFLEEAAGVSRYRERRRETENRLADTRENLTRVQDILRELGGQIDRLERQAQVAQQYRSHETERDAKQRMLWLVRRDDALAEQDRIAARMGEAVNALEERVGRQRALEAEIEAQRSAHYAAGDEVHAAQGRYYDANAQVARLESEIRYVVESQGQLAERIAALHEQAARARDDRDQARGDAEQARAELEGARARADEFARRVIALADTLPALEESVRAARGQLDEARAAALQTRQAIELSATRRRAAEQSLESAGRRGERLRAEAGQLQPPAQDELAAMRESLARAEALERETLLAQQAAESAWREADAARLPAQQQLREADAKVARIEARIAALRQLHERAQSQARIVPWLSRHGLSSLGRLWQRLRIEDGWETAIEAVLRERVEAMEVGRLEHVAGLVESDAAPAKVAFFSPQAAAPEQAQAPAPAGTRPLSDVVRATDAGLHALLSDWLSGCHASPDLASALAQRAHLAPGARCVTPAGHLIGPMSIQLYAPDSEQEGVLARQHELEHLGRELRAQQLIADETRAAVSRVEADAAGRLAALSSARDAHGRGLRSLAGVRLDAQRLEQQAERASHARGRIEHDLAEVEHSLQAARATIAQEGETFERLDTGLAERQQRVEELAQAFEAAERELAQRREALRRAERESQEASFATREIDGRIEQLGARIEQAERLEQQSQAERAQCDARLAELSDAGARQALEAALHARLLAEQSLSAARQRLDELTQTLRARDEERVRVEREQQPLRDRLGELQLREQAARLSAEQFAAQLAEVNADEAALRAGFPEAPKASWLQGEVTRLGNALAALGAVNLAALGELASARERQGFLDGQSADLHEAIRTLEDAIRKIDRETREVLRQTYDTVNRDFGKLFPELFGGGEARLILTGDEILDAGVQVMAQPPGKRNTSIHLLSGGEKALTAIALVFAIFQLNPAPFCLLDEVDAPLDEPNTERYCDMVRRMSGETQFVFITHNKIAMELAGQLIGVTMQERGVSRIVAVDLESAVRIAQAA